MAPPTVLHQRHALSLMLCHSIAPSFCLVGNREPISKRAFCHGLTPLLGRYQTATAAKPSRLCFRIKALSWRESMAINRRNDLFFNIRCTFSSQTDFKSGSILPPAAPHSWGAAPAQRGKKAFSLWGMDIDFRTCPVPKKTPSLSFAMLGETTISAERRPSNHPRHHSIALMGRSFRAWRVLLRLLLGVKSKNEEL